MFDDVCSRGDAHTHVAPGAGRKVFRDARGKREKEKGRRREKHAAKIPRGIASDLESDALSLSRVGVSEISRLPIQPARHGVPERFSDSAREWTAPFSGIYHENFTFTRVSAYIYSAQ